ncbi:MAG: Nif3-like dinuclear metal center hexameric protein [bacterium]|nr:Nif3-like dinuclear metal center hexameric protein [bacterium]
MNRLIPQTLAEKWDNIGLQIANENIRIRRVLITLDMTEKVFQYARSLRFDAVLSHHPVIFKPVSRLLCFKNKKHHLIRDLLSSNIALIVLHTNLDKYLFQALSRKLGLTRIKPLSADGFGSYGFLKKTLSLKAFLRLVKKKLKINHVTYTGKEDRTVRCVAALGGSGASLLESSLKEKKIDVLITSDVKYHSGQLAEETGVSVIQASHYDTEKVMLPELKKLLEKKFKDHIYFELNTINTDPFKYN